MKCTYCGFVGLEIGYVEEDGQYSKGYARWVPGPLRRDFLGVRGTGGRPRLQIDAFRCPRCNHLEMFAATEV